MNTLQRRWLLRGSLALAAGAAIRSASGAMCESSPARDRAPGPPVPTDVGPGRKFTPDGKVQTFVGNTVICHIPRPGAVFDQLSAAFEGLRAEVGDQHLTWLPTASYHVTMFNGVDDMTRLPGDWPQELPLNATMRVCNRYVGAHLRRVRLGFPLPLRLVIDDAEFPTIPTVLPLCPIDATQEARLRDLRGRISKAIGVRHPDDDNYRFHLSFAYYVRQFSANQEQAYRLAFRKVRRQLVKSIPVIELGAPEFCVFNDMYAFDTKFVLE
jgi:hypothetical protein